MRNALNDLKIPILLIVFMNGCAVFFLPLLPIDETRYLSAAWEMWRDHSFLVPHLNGLPYSHKPPFLFWAIHAGWALFGVNEMTPRLTIMIFSVMSLALVYQISLHLRTANRKAAACSALALASTGIWAAWSCVIMFDIVLSFWVLLGVLGILRASASRRYGWVLTAAGIAGGLLTKGPVVFVFLAPLLLLRPVWQLNRGQELRQSGWYGRAAGVFLFGFAAALLWAVPAAVRGGEEYRQAVLWGQTVNRVAASFAHRRPVWWYLPLLPAFFMPWLLFRPAMPRLRLKTGDHASRFCWIWIGAPLLIFSLISGKQFHYLVPLIPAGALLLGARIAALRDDGRPVTVRLIGGIFFSAGIVVLALPLFKLGNDVGSLTPGVTLAPGAGCLAAGLFLGLFRFKSIWGAVRSVAAVTTLVGALALSLAGATFLKSYEITPVAKIIQQNMQAGRTVVHVGKYHGQYQFLGRLTKPLLVIDSNAESVDACVLEHPDALYIIYKPAPGVLPDEAVVLYSQRYRGKTVFIWEMQPGSR
jgi:4-amino-4-deoxy-L-arabinose transferase-like glycosyltransferase